MYGRRYLCYPIVAAPGGDKIAIASRRDFDLGPLDRSTWRAPGEGLIPYCLDERHGRSLYLDGLDPEDAMRAPFYYLYARRKARRLWSVPWETGPLTRRDTAQPIFVFSSGRCGSTLLKNILYEAGITSISEPDFYTQAAGTAARWRSPPVSRMLRRVVGNLTRDLMTALGNDPMTIVKLRSQCCADPGVILGHVTPATRTIFMLRAFEPWAKSKLSIHDSTPAELVAEYIDVLECWAMLRRRTRCLFIGYEALLADPLGMSRELSAFLDRRIDDDAVQRALGADSQEGTPISRETTSGRRSDTSAFDQTLALWRSPGTRRSLDALELPVLMPSH